VVPGGTILTGGGSLMRGTVQAAEQILKMPVRLGVAHPDQVIAEEQWLAPAFSTALGLLLYSRQTRYGLTLSRGGVAGKKAAWMRKLTAVFEDLF
jgi:cell division protein FtsA